MVAPPPTKSRYPPLLPRLPEEQAILIQECPRVKGIMNHTYREYSRIPVSPNYKAPTSIDDMTFSQKVHHILSNPAFGNAISWLPHGRAFKVHRPSEFERDISPKYFGHGRYSSFLRSLNNYGFKHISKGPDRNCYYHELMLRGHAHLTQFMPRCRDARRLSADPDNEPNFYCINQIVGEPDSIKVENTVSSMRKLPEVRPVTPPTKQPQEQEQQGNVVTTTIVAALVAQALTTAVAPPPPPPPPPPMEPQDANDMVARLALAALLIQQLGQA